MSQVIHKLQQKVLRLFPEVPESESFYLTGGTALAHFYLKHRRSRDLDFFTPTEELVDSFSHRLEEKLMSEGISAQRQRGFRSFVELFIQQGEENTLIHLAQDAAFRFEPTKEFSDYPRLRVDNLTDIASNKLLALFGRAALRDFVDVYCIVKKEIFSPEDLAEKAGKKDPGFDLYWLGVAFERVHTFQENSPDLLMLLEPIRFQDLLDFFDQWRQRIAEQLAR